ncbi:uncharacterized protein [Populus alba]|uniref:uncharacterized protein n=1 Tax=Populus alba TaxID=43335 RepID=UPI003CC760D8
MKSLRLLLFHNEEHNALLIGYDLINFVTSDLQCPAINAENSATFKAANSHWIRQDKLTLHLKEDLTLNNHGNQTVTDFLQVIKLIANELAKIDHPVSDDDMTLYILNGLGLEFWEIMHLYKLENILYGHTAKTCLKHAPTDFSTNCVASSKSKDQKWLVDSASSHNMTTNLLNLSIHFEYDGTYEVVIGDGLGLQNRIIGATLLKGAYEDGVYPLPETLAITSKPAIAYVHECLTLLTDAHMPLSY